MPEESAPALENLPVVDILTTRTESDRSLEDAHRQKALITLTDIGLLKPVSEIDTYHGRVGKIGEKWEVDSGVKNGGNDSGNNNVNQLPTLYTGTEQIAKDFAIARKPETTGKLVLGKYIDKVRAYSPDQLQQWADKLNQDQQERWLRLSPDIRQNYQPFYYKISDLSNEDLVKAEALSLFYKATPEEKNTVSSQIASELEIQTHRITSPDTDARIIDLMFDASKLTDTQKAKYSEAINRILIPLTEGSPVDFEERDSLDNFRQAALQLQPGLIHPEQIPILAKSAGINEKTALKLSSALNATMIIRSNPIWAIRGMLNSSSKIIDMKTKVNGQEVIIPVNSEYILRLMRDLHIVGVKQSVRSATLGRDIDTISFFDMDRVGTTEQIEELKKEVLGKMGGLLSKFPELYRFGDKTPEGKLLALLAGSYSKPEKIIEAAKEVGNFKSLFESDTGVWEGFTLAEHTETVLRNFNNNFADSIPAEYLPILKLAILVHDIGKPVANSSGQALKQKEYNAMYAQSFMSRLDIEPKLQILITAIITDGLDVAFQAQINPNYHSAQNTLRMFSKKSIEQYLEKEPTEEQIKAFSEICKIIQTCDGGSYTSMAITRREGKGMFRNAESFNRSFQIPKGIGRDDISYVKA